jgi:photosystem II stability/assembly factor-like uncharacterized protein
MKIKFTFLILLILCSFTNAQWVQTNGPNVSSVLSLTSSDKNIFAATVGGIFLSTNNGANWKKTNDGMTGTSITSIVAMGNYVYVGCESGGVFVSSNNGTNWTQANSGIDNTCVISLAVSGTDVFAGTTGGVYISTNYGNSWKTLGPFSGAWSLAVSGNYIFVGATDDYLYLSTNYGISWAKINYGVQIQYNTILTITISGNNIFLGTVMGVFMSSDNGKNWKQAGPNTFAVFAFLANGSNIFVSDGPQLFLSTNSGTNWTQINNGLDGKKVKALTAIGNNIFAGTENGIFYSTNNGTVWTPVNLGLINAQINGIVNSGSNILASVELYGLYLSSDNGNNWTNVNTSYAGLFYINGMNTYSIGLGGLMLSTDYGKNWTMVSEIAGYITAMAGYGSHIVVSLSYVPNITTYGVFHSPNSGKNWTKIMGRGDGIACLIVCNNQLFAGYGGDWMFGRGIYINRDYGINWDSAGLDNQNISSLAVKGTNLFASADSGVFLSTDYGTNWMPIDNGLDIHQFYTFAFSGNNIFAGGGSKVFLSTNNGTNWTDIGTDLPSTHINFLTADSNFVYAGTDGDGVWKRPLSELVGVSNEENNAPQEFTLSQNYPNPFNPSTTINYSLPHPGNVKLTVYNSIGSKVATIANDYKPAGNYSVQFNASTLASGIYLYRLESGNYSSVKKFILMK